MVHVHYLTNKFKMERKKNANKMIENNKTREIQGN